MKKRIHSFFTQGHQRTLLAKKNILFSLLIKFFTMLATFTIISMSIKYLGKDAYGVWVILAGLAVWTDFFDFGFTHGLRNMLAESIANGDNEKGKYYVSTSFAVMILIASIITLVFIPLIEYLDWNRLLKINFLPAEEIQALLYIVLASFILKMIYKPITAVLNAVQWPSITQLISLIGILLSLICLYFLSTAYETSSIFAYAITQSAAPVIILMLASAYLFMFKFQAYKPSIKYIKLTYFKNIARLGSVFFLIQFSGLIIYQTDNIIIANLYGPASVTDYNIVLRYFSILSIGMGVIMSPFWSAFTDAYIKKEFDWIQQLVRKLTKIMALFAVAAILFFLSSNFVYKLWIDDAIHIPYLLSGMMALSVVLYGFFSIYTYVINGVGKIKLLMYSSIVAAIINIPLSYFFADTLQLGISGVVLGTLLCSTFSGIISMIQYYKIINSNASGIWNQ